MIYQTSKSVFLVRHVIKISRAYILSTVVDPRYPSTLRSSRMGFSVTQREKNRPRPAVLWMVMAKAWRMPESSKILKHPQTKKHHQDTIRKWLIGFFLVLLDFFFLNLVFVQCSLQHFSARKNTSMHDCLCSKL